MIVVAEVRHSRHSRLSYHDHENPGFVATGRRVGWQRVGWQRAESGRVDRVGERG
jgi:hypothetical protein